MFVTKASLSYQALSSMEGCIWEKSLTHVQIVASHLLGLGSLRYFDSIARWISDPLYSY